MPSWASGAWEVTGLESNKVIPHFQVWHSHHALHQVLPMGVKPPATLDGFGEQFEQLCFGRCACHGLLLRLVSSCPPKHREHVIATHHPFEWLSALIPGDVSPIRGVAARVSFFIVTCLSRFG